jgi:putative aldouronate transport system substrate-binding protein
MVLTLASGCSKEQKSTATVEPTKAPLSISMMNNYFTPEAPKADNPAIKKIEEYTNTKLNITWIPSTAFDEKVNASIASNDLPQIFLVKVYNHKQPAILNAIRSGMFWEVGPYLKDYPNLSKINPIILNNASVDGKNFGIPRYRTFGDAGMIFRKDWLDNLGLSEPKTTDDLYNVLKAFTNNDPDKNGKQDTYGLSMTGLNPLIQYNVWFGAPNGWGLKDGQMQPAFMYKEHLDVLKLFKKMFDEKLLNPDFAVIKDSSLAVNQGKAGMVIGTMNDVTRVFTDLTKLNPNAKLDILNAVSGPGGTKAPGGAGYNGMFMFPKSTVKTEAELKQLLGFMDKLADTKMQDLFTWGIEDTHFKMDGGSPVRLDEKLYNDEIGTNLYQMRIDDGSLAMKGNLTPIAEKLLTLRKKNDQIAVPNLQDSLVSTTQTEKGGQLDKIISDAQTKFIMGNIDEQGWNKAIEEWRKNGGDKIIQEYNTEYAKSKK